MTQARIDTSDLDRVARALGAATGGSRASWRGIQEDLVDLLHRVAPALEADIRGRARTSTQRRAASTVRVAGTSVGLEARGGGGAGLGGIVWAGGEYGGRKQRRVTYATRSPLGRPYAVRRRTTMQFLPHLGREGYMFWPAVRDKLPEVERETVELLEGLLTGGRR